MTKPKSAIDNLARLITTLAEKLELTDRQIADILWLALKRQEFAESPSDEQRRLRKPNDRKSGTSTGTSVDKTDSGKADIEKDIEESSPCSIPKEPIYTSRSFSPGQGLPIRVPDAPSLREPIHLAQSLHPLVRRVPTGRRTILDEVATVERIAKEKVCLPVLRSEPEPWLDLALVIDESQSMLIWRHTLRELQRLLKHYGIFRELRVWGIKPNEKGEELQIFSRWGSNQRLADPKEIIDPTGRRLILVVSDCVSNLWRKGMIFPVLHEWTQKQPLAVIQMLPEWMWRRSALGLGTAVNFSSSIAGAANRDLLVNKKFLSEKRTKIPVLTLELEKAARWSQMLVGKADAAVPGYILPPQLNIQEHPLLQRQQQAIATLDASQRVDRFRKTTSPLGRKLAGLLAAAPVISLPVVRLIQESLLPESRQVQVAEVFLGGLLKPKSETPIEADTNPDAVEYEFIEPEIRDIFLEDAPVRDSTDVLNAVSRYVAEQMGKSLDEFMAVLKTPGTAEGGKVKPFAEVTARILRNLGGNYLAIAKQLEQAMVEAPQFPQLKTILLVEDNPKAANQIRHILQREGKFTVILSEDFEQIMNYARSGGVDLILLNYWLNHTYYQRQKMMGANIAKIIRSDPSISSELVLIGFSDNAERETEFRPYCNGFYSKQELLSSGNYQKFVDYLQNIFNQVTQVKSFKTGKNYAIAIGINQYSNLPSTLRVARYAVRDALMMRDWFGHGFEQVYLLTPVSSANLSESEGISPSQPTQDGWQQFWQTNFSQASLSAEDTLWFFFSGYGIHRAGRDYLLLADSKAEDLERTALPLVELVRKLQSSGAGLVILMLDADRERSFSPVTSKGFTSDKVTSLEQQLRGELNSDRRLIIFYASSPEQGAYEMGVVKSRWLD